MKIHVQISSIVLHSFILVGTVFGLSGSGTETDPYLISSFADFEEFRTNSSFWAQGIYTRLEADIDLNPSLPESQVYTEAVIAPDTDNSDGGHQGRKYLGIFDGNGHVISNLNIIGTQYLGLFGYVGTVDGYASYGIFSQIMNLGLNDVNIQSPSQGDKVYIGGLVGSMECGSISDCYVTGIVNGSMEAWQGSEAVGGLAGITWYVAIDNCHTDCQISGRGRIGGLVGEAGNAGWGLHFYCPITNCYTKGEVRGYYSVGGLAGVSAGPVLSCYATGNVEGDADGINTGGLLGVGGSGTKSDCYATGAIKGGSQVGGLIGFFVSDTTENPGIIRNCYAIGAVSGDGGNVGGVVGLKTGSTSQIVSSYHLRPEDGGGPVNGIGIALSREQMYYQSSYSGWDFSNTWVSQTNDFPKLLVFLSDDIKVMLVAAETLTDQNKSVTTPVSITNIPETGQVFYVELWASDIGDVNTGLSGIYVNLDFSPAVEILALNHSSTFNFLTSGSIQGHSVLNFGGAALPHGGGIDPEWTRIGWIEVKLVTDASAIHVNFNDKSCSAAAFGRGTVPWGLVATQNVNLFKDCNGNGISDETDIGYGTSFDCNANGIPDECDIVNGTSMDCNGNGIPDECDIAAGTSTDINHDGIPDDCQARMDILFVAVAEPPYYTPETRTTRPQSIAAIGRSSKYYVELWAQCRDETSDGLLRFSLDIPYDSFSSVLMLHHNTAMVNPSGTILSDRVDNFGGQFIQPDQGVTPEWVRLGWLEMRANLETESSGIALLPGEERITEFDDQQVPWEFVNMPDLILEILPPLRSYDLDMDSWIGLGDLSFFAVSWQQNAPPANETHDFDFDGFVGPGDLSWFVTGWNKSVHDISVVYPPYLIEPPRQTTFVSPPESRAVVAVPPPAPADVAVAVTLTETASPSDTRNALAQSVEMITAGHQYAMEFWVSDIGQVNSGITSVYVDAVYSGDVFQVQSVQYGESFNLFTQANASSGLLANLGGSTLNSGVAVEPSWIRFGIVQVMAITDEDVFTIDLLPSQLGISAYGRGKVPWEFVHVIPVRSHLMGDFDQNRKVDMIDFAIMVRAWNSHAQDAAWNPACDLNQDESVEIGDLVRMAAHWLKQG